MSKAIVYQGANEQYRCRIVSDEGEFEGHSDLFETVEEAIAFAEDTGFEVENKIEQTQTEENE